MSARATAGQIPEPGGSESRWALALVALLVAAELWLVASVAWFPSNDGPAHLYSAWVADRLASGAPTHLAGWFERNPRTIFPNVLYTWFLEIAVHHLPAGRAQAAGIAIYLVALPISIGLLARCLGRRPALPMLGAVVLSFNFLCFMGFFSFLWSVACAFGFLAALEAALQRPSVARIGLANLVLAACFCSHLVGFGLALLGGTALTMTRPPRRWPVAAAATLPVVLASPWFWPATVGTAAALKWSNTPLHRLATTLSAGIGTSFGGAEQQVASIAGVLALVVAAASLVRGSSAGRRQMVALMVAFLAATVFLPSAVGSGSYLLQRAMLAFWLVVALALDPPGRLARATAMMALGLLVAVHLIELRSQIRFENRRIAAYLEAARWLPHEAELFCVTEEPPAREFVARPMATVHALLHMQVDAVNFSHYEALPENAPQFPVRYTAAALSRAPREKGRDTLPLAKISKWAEYVVVWGREIRAGNELESAGFRPVRQVRGLRLYWNSTLGTEPPAASASTGQGRRRW